MTQLTLRVRVFSWALQSIIARKRVRCLTVDLGEAIHDGPTADTSTRHALSQARDALKNTLGTEYFLPQVCC